jgi:peptidoglycan/LPS O-acetylase OafA/YrhL
MQRLRALDGLRAVSILLVLLDHLLINRLIPGDGPWWRLDMGRVGVRVFFVISGFLITGLLIRELRGTGRIQLGRFFFRRFLRLAPPALVLLGVVGGLAALGLSDAGPRAFLHAATYTSNYVAMPWDLAHTWSLSVEEQFYLFWPLALAAWGLGGGARLAAVFLVAAPIFRYVAASTPHWPYFYLFGFEANADALAAGCGVALLRDAAWLRPGWRRFVTGPVFWVAVAALALCWPLTALSPAREIWGISMANLAVALVLERCLRVPDERATRFLDHPFLVRVGVLSYALYLCQQPLLAAQRDLPLGLRLVLLAAAALALHRFVELPALRLRRRLEARFFGPEAAPAVHTPSPGAMAPP